MATEAQYLLARYVFEDLGYRRYEWKCDALNQASRKAAERLGFTYEGCFRQAIVYKGRTRDTDWLSIIDQEWPAIKQRFEAWLDPSNFDANGQQKQSLRDSTKVKQRNKGFPGGIHDSRKNYQSFRSLGGRIRDAGGQYSRHLPGRRSWFDWRNY